MPTNGFQIVKRNKSSVVLHGKKNLPFYEFQYSKIDSLQFYKSSENNEHKNYMSKNTIKYQNSTQINEMPKPSVKDFDLNEGVIYTAGGIGVRTLDNANEFDGNNGD